MINSRHGRFIVCFLLSMVAFFSVRTHAAAAVPVMSPEQTQRFELTNKVVEHYRNLDNALALLAQQFERHVLASSDSTEFLERIDFLRNLIAQVVFCVERPADKKSLQFLCALSATILECAEWLSRAEDMGADDGVLGTTLNLDKIKVDAFPEDLSALEQSLELNIQRCTKLSVAIEGLQVGFFTRLLRGTRHVLGFIAHYTIQSKAFAGIGVGLMAAYLLVKTKAREEAAMDPGSYALSRRNRINKEEVTGKNLYKLSSKPYWGLRRKLSTWFQENAPAWQVLVEQPGNIGELEKKCVAIAQVLQAQGINNGSRWNIGFLFPGSPEWRMKISGPINRAQLQAANQDKSKIAMVDPTFLVPTYQTASRSFGALKLAEAIKTYKLEELELVESYIWSPKKQSEDECCVILEKDIKNLKLLGEYSPAQLPAVLTEKRIGQILLAAKHVGLWNLTPDNIGINLDTGKVVLLDLEQPNTTKAAHQFNKDKDRYVRNVNSGVQSFYQSLPVGSAVRDCVEAWARRDSEVMEAPNANELRGLFAQNKKAQEESLRQAKKKEQEEKMKLQDVKKVSQAQGKSGKPEGEI